MNIQLFLTDFKTKLNITDKIMIIDMNVEDIEKYLDFFIQKDTFSFKQYETLIANTLIVNNEVSEVIQIRSLLVQKAKNTFKEISDFSKIGKIAQRRSINKNYFFSTISGKFKYIIGNVIHTNFNKMKYDVKNIIKTSDIYFSMPKAGPFVINKAFEENLKINGILALDYLQEYNYKKYNKLFRDKFVNYIYGFSFVNSSFNLYFTNNKKAWKEIYLNGENKKFSKIEEFEEFKLSKIFLDGRFVIMSDNRFYNSNYINYKVIKTQLSFDFEEVIPTPKT